MSAWSSSTGKAQLSYADRLRQASKSSSTTKQDPPSSSGFATRAVAKDAIKPPSSSVSSSAAVIPSGRLSSPSPVSLAAAASGSTSNASVSSLPTKTTSASAESIAIPNAGGGGPTLNVWEARRKQLADREAEKERERRSTLAHQKQAPPVPSTSAASDAAAAGNKSKQPATEPKKANERQLKGSSTSSQSDRKSSKPATQPTSRASNAVPISSTSATPSTPPASAQTAEKTNASTTVPKVKVASSPKTATADHHSAEEADSADRPAEQSASTQPSQSPSSSNKAQKSKADDKVKPSDAVDDFPRQAKAANASTQTQTAAAQVLPSSALSVQLSFAPQPSHDDIPGSPVTVASAIEEVLKNGGAQGGQTEDDDAWLARIHLLNGGQNMPNFGGFGPNGASALSEEAEAQAAKKAERAVAAAWGVGKSVWNKSQQNRADAGKDTTAAPSSGDAVKGAASRSTANIASANDDNGNSAPSPASVAPNGVGSGSDEMQYSADTASQKQAITDEKAENCDADASPTKKVTGSKSRVPAEQQKQGKGSAKTAAASVPPFEDVNNWPSPLDAGKKPTEKARSPAATGDHNKVESTKTQSKTPKSLYETLGELQVRLAPGASPQQAGGAAGARKGKQQWVSILPEITHTASTSGAKPNRPTSEPKGAKGGNKQPQKQQPRKDGNKGSGQTQQGTQNEKKDGVNKAKSTRGEDKAQARGATAEVTTSTKSAESRGQPVSQGDKVDSGPKSTTTGRAASSGTEQASAQPTAGSGQTQMTSAAASSPIARGESPSKQLQQHIRTHFRAQPNGISSSLQPQPQPNGFRLPKSAPSSSGAVTPITNRSSPRGSVASSPKVHALPRGTPQAVHEFSAPSGAATPPPPPPLFYGPSGVATPMLSSNAPPPASWLPYNAYARPPAFLFDTTTQTGAPLPSGVLGQLLGQIEFYFSQHNLQGDFFLRQKMDGQGWVEIKVVAGFKRVLAITADLGMVKDALLCSAVLDVDEERLRVRRRFGWELFTLPTSMAERLERPGEKGEDKEADVEEEEEALGVVSASGFGGTLEA